MKTSITRKSIVGFGWRYWTPEDPSLPAAPSVTGTIKTCRQKISEDRTLQSEGEMILSTAWFILLDGQWRRVSNRDLFDWAASDLYYQQDGRYITDEAVIEVEDPASSGYLTTAQAADLTGLESSHLRRLIRSGQISGVKLGHDWLIPAGAVDSIQRQRRPKNQTAK